MIVRANAALIPGVNPRRGGSSSAPVPYRGLHLVRGRRRGMGDEVGMLTGAGLLAKDLANYVNTAPYGVEQGIAPSLDQFRAIVQTDVGAYCGQWPDRCASGPPSVETAVAQYAATLAAEQNRVARGVQQGSVALPYSPSSYTPASLPLATWAPPTAVVTTGTPAPAAQPAPAAHSNAPAFASVPSPAPDTASQSNAPAANKVPPAVASNRWGFLTDAAFFGIPNWLLAGAAIGAVYAFSGGNGRR